MKIIEFFKRAFLTRKCLLCGEVIDYDRVYQFCDECFPLWINHLDTLCNKCGYDVDNCNCKPPAFSKTKVDVPFVWCTFYKSSGNSPANTLVYKLKREHNIHVIDFCAERMKERLISLCKKRNILIRDFVVTYPQRRKGAVTKYGYDHTKLLANSFARKIGANVEPCFENIGKKEQKGLKKRGRYANAIASYKLCDDIDVKGKNIILIDDVITTGATVHICYELLKSAGANEIIILTFACDN